MNRHFAKVTQMVGQHLKRCSASLVIRAIQIKATLKHYYLSVRKSKIKMTLTSMRDTVEPPELYTLPMGMQNIANILKNSLTVS